MDTIRVAVIGAGFAAGAHVEALSRVPGVEVAGVAASRAETAQAAAARFGLSRAYGHYREVLADEGVDAVHNCTPNDVHFDVNTAALRAGKHVLSEKPLAMDKGQTGELVREAEEAGVVAGVCFNYRHYPLVRQVKALLESGEGGAVHLVHGGYLQDWLLFDTDWNWRLDATRAGASRAVADIGSHWMDLVQYVTGDLISEVYADLDTVHRIRRRPSGKVQTFAGAGDVPRTEVEVSTEDAGTVLLRMEGGARGTFIVSQVSAGRKNRLFFELDAANASFAWDQEEPNRLWIGHRDRPNEELTRDPGLLDPPAAALAHYPAGHQEGWPDALKNLFLDFYAAVSASRQGVSYRPSFASFRDAHRITQCVEAILASHRSGRWEKIGAAGEAVQ